MDDALAVIIGALDDNEGEIQEAAAQALSYVGGDRAVIALEKALEIAKIPPSTGKQNDRHILQIAFSLCWLGHSGGLDIAIDALQGVAWTRKRAAEALGELGDERAVDALISALEDDEIELSFALTVAEALGEIGDERAVIPIIEALVPRNLEFTRSSDYGGHSVGGNDDSLGEVIARILGKIGGSVAIPRLIEIVESSGYPKRFPKRGFEKARSIILEPVDEGFRLSEKHHKAYREHLKAKKGLKGLTEAQVEEWIPWADKSKKARGMKHFIGTYDDCAKDAAMKALERLPEDGVDDAIAQLIKNTGKEFLHSELAWLLFHIDGRRAARILLEHQKELGLNTGWGSLRQLMSFLDDDRILGLLIEALGVDSLRGDAADQLYLMSFLKPQFSVFNDGYSVLEPAIGPLIEIVTDGKEEEVYWAVCALGAIGGLLGNNRCLKSLIGVFENGSFEAETRARAIHSLAEFIGLSTGTGPRRWV